MLELDGPPRLAIRGPSDVGTTEQRLTIFNCLSFILFTYCQEFITQNITDSYNF